MIAISIRLIGAVRTLSAVAALASSSLYAAEAVDEIVVTATRIPTAYSRVGDSITVIDADAARRSQKLAVSDLLLSTPGIAMSRDGGIGGTTSIRIRGAETDQTVVLIDGVKLNDPSTGGGGFNFSNLLVNDIARVEILRGSQSTLWGSQAIGGVVNIITSEPSGPLSTTIDTQAGSFGTAQTTAHVQEGNDRYGWRVGANYLTTDGISAYDEDLGGREEDGYRNVGANVRGRVHLSDSISAELRSTWSRGDFDFDGYPPPAYSFADTTEHGTTKEWVSYAGLKIDSFAQRLQHRIGVAYTDTDRENFDPTSSVRTTFDAYGRNLRYEYQGTLTFNDRVNTVFGLERERSELSAASPNAFDPNPIALRRDVTIDSAFAQIQVMPIEPLTLSAGLRYDDHETFGSDTSAQAAVAWSATDSTIVRASFGEGFKSPTLYQLYSEYGTATLEPEESHDWDLGIEQRVFGDRIVVSATYFERETRNMIDFASCFGVDSERCVAQPFGYYDNIQRTRADGYELALTAQLIDRLRVAANYTGLDARNDSRGSFNFDKALPRRPKDTAFAELTYDWPNALTTTVAVQYVGRNFDNAFSTTSTDAYTLVDLRAAYRISTTLEIYARVDNALDKEYETTRTYGTLGRGAYVGMRLAL